MTLHHYGRRERRRLRLGVRGQLDEGVAAAEGFGDQGFMRDETEAMAADARARRFIFRSRFIFFFFRRYLYCEPRKTTGLTLYHNKRLFSLIIKSSLNFGLKLAKS